jgi:ribosomal protein S27E
MTVKKLKKKTFKFNTEIVKGECPTCNQITTLVGITSQFYRCMECGGDLEQHVNGKISYLPIMSSSTDGGKIYVKDWK